MPHLLVKHSSFRPKDFDITLRSVIKTITKVLGKNNATHIQFIHAWFKSDTWKECWITLVGWAALWHDSASLTNWHQLQRILYLDWSITVVSLARAQIWCEIWMILFSEFPLSWHNNSYHAMASKTSCRSFKFSRLNCPVHSTTFYWVRIPRQSPLHS